MKYSPEAQAKLDELRASVERNQMVLLEIHDDANGYITVATTSNKTNLFCLYRYHLRTVVDWHPRILVYLSKSRWKINFHLFMTLLAYQFKVWQVARLYKKHIAFLKEDKEHDVK